MGMGSRACFLNIQCRHTGKGAHTISALSVLTYCTHLIAPKSCISLFFGGMQRILPFSFFTFQASEDNHLSFPFASPFHPLPLSGNIIGAITVSAPPFFPLCPLNRYPHTPLRAHTPPFFSPPHTQLTRCPFISLVAHPSSREGGGRKCGICQIRPQKYWTKILPSHGTVKGG